MQQRVIRINRSVSAIARGLFTISEKMMAEKLEKVLIFKVGAIGDILMTTPLLRALREKLPESKIDYLVGKWSASVLHGNPHIDEIIEFDDNIVHKRQFSRFLKLIRNMRKRKYDLIIVLDRSYLFGVAARMMGRTTIGFDRYNEGFAHTYKVKYADEKHDIEYYLDIVRKLKGDRSSDMEVSDMEVFLSDNEKRYANDFIKKNNIKRLIGICAGGAVNPGQEVALKRWPIENFVAIVKLLKKDKDTDIILLGGPEDSWITEHFKDCKVYNLIGKCSLKETAAIMEHCDHVISNDSGPMHLAVATGAKVISIFGPTDPIKLAPIGKKHHHFCAKLECQPCYHDGKFKECKHHSCMKAIKPEDIVKQIKA